MVPERVGTHHPPDQIAAEAADWLREPDRLAGMRDDLRSLRGESGAVDALAALVQELLPPMAGGVAQGGGHDERGHPPSLGFSGPELLTFLTMPEPSSCAAIPDPTRSGGGEAPSVVDEQSLAGASHARAVPGDPPGGH